MNGTDSFARCCTYRPYAIGSTPTVISHPFSDAARWPLRRYMSTTTRQGAGARCAEFPGNRSDSAGQTCRTVARVWGSSGTRSPSHQLGLDRNAVFHQHHRRLTSNRRYRHPSAIGHMRRNRKSDESQRGGSLPQEGECGRGGRGAQGHRGTGAQGVPCISAGRSSPPS